MKRAVAQSDLVIQMGRTSGGGSVPAISVMPSVTLAGLLLAVFVPILFVNEAGEIRVFNVKDFKASQTWCSGVRSSWVFKVSETWCSGVRSSWVFKAR